MNSHRSLVDRTVLGNACKIALVVGTCLNAINQGPQIWQGQDIAWGSFALNFVVPFLVSSYSGVKALKKRTT